jgi:hypothetical protein
MSFIPLYPGQKLLLSLLFVKKLHMQHQIKPDIVLVHILDYGGLFWWVAFILDLGH